MALPRAHTASSSPAQAGEPSSTANAGRLMSTAPKQKPTGSVASASVRTPPDRNAPSRPRLPAPASGSHSRDGRCATNAAVPASEHAAHRPSAAIGEIAAMVTAAASGPTVKTVSISTESSANAVSSSSSRSGRQRLPQRAHRGAHRGDREPADEAGGHQRGRRRAGLRQRDEHDGRGDVDEGQRQQDAPLPDPIDQAALERDPDRRAEPERAVDQAGDRERVALGGQVQDERQPVHRDRQPGDQRRREQRHDVRRPEDRSVAVGGGHDARR